MQLLLEQMNGYVLVAVLVLCILVLSKATDILVDEAISLSLEWGMSELVIGATIVSLGTSLPELAVSISSSLKGNGILSLGNVIGSTIVNTSFILGIGALYGSIPVNRKTAYKHTVLSALSLLLPTPALADGLVDNVNGMTMDANGNVVHFTGIVIGRDGRGISVSGRSLGSINVQIICERLGGGGHLTMAGAQMEDMELDEAEALVRNTIEQYLQEVMKAE